MAIEKPDAKAAVIGWIDEILKKKQWNGTDLARKSNLAPSTILRLLNDEEHRFVPSLKTLKKVSDGSGEPIPQQVMQAIGPSIGRFEDEVPASPMSRPLVMSSSRAAEAIRRTKVKVKHVSSLPFAISGAQTKEEVLVNAPEELEGDATAFAFYNPDRALEPWVSVGTLMFATKRRDPKAGDMVLVTDKEGRSRVRLIEDMNEAGLVLTKCHPPEAEETMAYGNLGDVAIVVIINFMAT